MHRSCHTDTEKKPNWSITASRHFKDFKKDGYKSEDKSRVDIFRDECKNCIDNSKKGYIKQMGMTSKKAYWKIMNRVKNKCNAPKIPPILSDSEFIINCKEKAVAFASFFSFFSV